jgi:hypothetical protein
MIHNKKAMDIAIPVLVLMTIILVVSALAVFNLNSRKVEGKIEDYKFLEEIYFKENEINFYIKDIMEEAVSKIEKGMDIKTQFIDNFKKEMQRYKKDEVFYVKELEPLENQLDRNKIIIENKKITFKFKINFEKRFGDKMIVLYSYEKDFSELLA